MGKRIFIIVFLITAGIFGFFYYDLNYSEKSMVVGDGASTSETVFTARHYYKDGVHKLLGEITLPHSCYEVNKRIQKTSNFPEKFTVIIVATDHFLDQPVCANFRTKYPFVLVFEADENVEVAAVLNSEPIRVELTRQGDWFDPKGNSIEEVDLNI